MITIQEVIVVEGKSDVATLSNIVKAEFIITNGFEISKSTLNTKKIRKINYTFKRKLPKINHKLLLSFNG